MFRFGWSTEKRDIKMIGTSYEIDFFLSHIVLSWLISALALASANEKFVLSDWR